MIFSLTNSYALMCQSVSDYPLDSDIHAPFVQPNASQYPMQYIHDKFNTKYVLKYHVINMKYTSPHTQCHPRHNIFHSTAMSIFSRQAPPALKCAVFPVPQYRVLQHNKRSPVSCRIHCVLYAQT